jgi:short-subunit dehydrogenase
MVERRSGHVAAVASLAAMLGLPAAGAYCASKSAVITLMESLRTDLYPLGVRVTTVCPSFVDTPMITDEERATMKHLMTADAAAQRIAHAIERGRAEYWFPWQEWLLVRLIRCAPLAVSRRIMAYIPEMEDTVLEE